MPKIRTHTVQYTVSPNRHSMDVNIMYDTNKKNFYVVIPESFYDTIKTMSDELKDKYFVQGNTGIRGIYGLAIVNKNESELIDVLEDLFYYCGNAVKKVRNVIIITSKGKSSKVEDQYYQTQKSNKEAELIKQEFKFVLAIETIAGEGKPIYTHQNVGYTNTIDTNQYGDKSVIIDDTPENRAFLENIYDKLDNLIINLKKFFASSETVIELIASNQKLLN